jgi:hypothetical protein
MFDSFGIAAFHLSRHPLLLMIAVVAMLRVMGRAGRRETQPGWLTSLAGCALTVTAVLGLATYVAVVVFYARGPQYFDAAEPTISAVGWLFRSGLPVYHAVDSAERYSHIYGPMVFIAQGTAMDVFGPTIETSKWVGGSLALGALAFTFCAVRPTIGILRAIIVTGICALVLLGFRNYSFWTRAEPMQAFCVSAALVAALSGRRYGAPLVLGLCAGVLWNLKITGPLYSLPLFVLLLYRAGWRPALVSVGVALVTAIVPFAVFSNISLDAYLTWVRLSAQTGLLLSTLRQNIEWAAFLAVPLVLTYLAAPRTPRDRDREWSSVTLALFAAVCGVVIAGSKPGAGPYHLLPLLPIVCHLVAARLDHGVTASPAGAFHVAIGFVLVAGFIAIREQVQFVTIMAGRQSLDIAMDIDRFARTHHGVIEMGYGVNDPLTFARPLLVFRNNSYFLDQPAVGEHQLAGLPIPAATIDALRHCRVEYWLIPRDEVPFSAVNMYSAVYMRPLFSDAFRLAFFQTHARTESTDYFDVWQCRPGP